MICGAMFIPSMIQLGVRHNTGEIFRLDYLIHNSGIVILKIREFILGILKRYYPEFFKIFHL